MYWKTMENVTERLVTGSMNCSLEPRLWWWHGWHCVDGSRQLIGLTIGIIATILWSSGHVCLYRFKRMRTRSSHQRSIRLFLMMNWFSDAIGCVGAGLSQQLFSQLIFGVMVTFVHTACGVHSFISRIDKPSHTSASRVSGKKKTVRHLSKKSLFRACMCPLNVIFLAATLASLSAQGYLRVTAKKRTAEDIHRNIHEWIPVEWLVGYVFGSMAGVLHCFAKILDILDSYISVEFNKTMAAAYAVSILGEFGYVASVMSQRVSLLTDGHSLPWVVPRLVAAGIDMGILVQRITQKRKGKRRKISEESAASLLSSSESEHEWLSDDSEEVIWMPLKSVDSAIPTHPVCTSRVQINRMEYSPILKDVYGITVRLRAHIPIILESDKSIDSVDWFGSSADTNSEGKADAEEIGTDSSRDDNDVSPRETETEAPDTGSDVSDDMENKRGTYLSEKIATNNNVELDETIEMHEIK